MKALTLKQPWAWLLIHGGKDIENRDWPTGFRGRVAVHTSSKPYLQEYEAAQVLIHVENIKLPHPLPEHKELLYGAIIGTVEIVDCVEWSASPWFYGDYGFVVRDPIALPEPIPCRGLLKFWEIPPLALRQLEQQLAKGAK